MFMGSVHGAGSRSSGVAAASACTGRGHGIVRGAVDSEHGEEPFELPALTGRAGRAGGAKHEVLELMAAALALEFI